MAKIKSAKCVHPSLCVSQQHTGRAKTEKTWNRPSRCWANRLTHSLTCRVLPMQRCRENQPCWLSAMRKIRLTYLLKGLLLTLNCRYFRDVNLHICAHHCSNVKWVIYRFWSHDDPFSQVLANIWRNIRCHCKRSNLFSTYAAFLSCLLSDCFQFLSLVTLAEDIDTFYCSAQNAEGAAVANISLEVLVGPILGSLDVTGKDATTSSFNTYSRNSKHLVEKQSIEQ